MPEEKTIKPKQRRSKKRNFYPFPFNLTKQQVDALDQIAKENNVRRTDISRFAVEFYLRNYRVEELNQRETSLERRIRLMEDHLATLLVRCIRICGQILFFITLPLLEGLPQKRLSQQGFDLYYRKSLVYAAILLKNTNDVALPELPAPKPQAQSGTPPAEDSPQGSPPAS